MAGEIIGRPTYRLIQRFTARLGQDVNVAASANAVQVASGNIAVVPVQATQALRIVEMQAAVSDSNATHFLTCLNFIVQLMFGNFDASLRRWTASYGNVLLGPTGLGLHQQDDELLLGQSDYSELGLSEGMNLVMLADMSNSDAAIHPVHFSLTAIMELYQVQVAQPLNGGGASLPASSRL